MFLKKAILFTNATLGLAFSNTVIVDTTINNNHTICGYVTKNSSPVSTDSWTSIIKSEVTMHSTQLLFMTKVVCGFKNFHKHLIV